MTTTVPSMPALQPGSREAFKLGVTGIYPNIALRDYLDLDAVSSTLLKAFRRSPAHALALLQEPRWSDALMIGDAVHIRTLQPEIFGERYRQAPPCSATTEKGKPCSRSATVLWGGEPYCTQHAGGSDDQPTLLIEKDYGAVCLMSDTVRANSTAATLLESNGEVELSLVWSDKDTGLLCKARLDKHASNYEAIVDLKTTTDASPEKFSRAIFDYGYEIQGAHYLDGCAALKIAATTFSMIPVEKDAPHCLAVYELEPEAIGLGYEQVRRSMALLAKCRRDDHFPGYPLEINRIGVPTWARDQINRKAVQS